jgi:hypothetical protein
MKMIFRRVQTEEDDEDPKTLDRFRVKFAISVVRSLDGSGEEVWNPKRL